MSLFFYVYTIVLLIVCIITASVCGAGFLVSRSRRYIPQAGFFAFYFVELSLIFGSEWMQQNVAEIAWDNYYAVDTPVLRVLLGAAILACFWETVLDMLDIASPTALAIPTVGMVFVQTIILSALPYGPMRQWLFYTMRQVSLAACLAYAYGRYRTSADEVLRQRMGKRRTPLIVLATLVLCITLEDAYVILVAPIPAANSSFAGLFLSSRNFSENAMMLYAAWYVCREAIRSLSLRYQEPPEAAAGTASKQRLQGHIENRLHSYSAEHGLSKREREILGLAMEGRSNREIASELILAEGTVKTHLHNIMKKCGAANREELRRSFWAS